LPAKYERVKIKLPHAKKIHGKSIVFLLKEADTERRRRSSRKLCYVKFVLKISLQPYQNTFLPIKNKILCQYEAIDIQIILIF
jgi:hypothetical protein